MNRNEIRKTIRRQRRAMSSGQRHAAAQQLARRAKAWRRFLTSQRIAFYLPNDGEMDLRPLMDLAQRMGKECYLPVISSTPHNRLWFAPYREGQPLKANIFGIPEPAAGKFEGLSARCMDLLLMPLVAFDPSGNRLGMGGGFYDRTLAFLGHRNSWQRPYLAGVAYEIQRVEALPVQEWDIPLQAVITDEALYLP